MGNNTTCHPIDSQATFGGAAAGAFNLWPLLLCQALLRLLLLFAVVGVFRCTSDYSISRTSRQPEK